MPLVSGSRIGPYEIVAPIGAGGMGEVYRARDTKLDRHVALKILPAAFASDPDRVARFEREARLLASLNHANIATVYGVEEASGVTALVMELVEGETLAEQVSRLKSQGSGLPLLEALMIARQIADALEAAHERGIVHRDLKPANIKITPAGTAKVLDFGLAKESDTGPAGWEHDRDPSQAPTTTAASGTREGMILGTAAYMSPEQARGLAVDKRTDIWAFGCVLYEMLTGSHAFTGATTSDVLVSVLDRQPDWTELPSTTAPGIRRLLRRCLDKDPRRRLHDIADARLEIDESFSASDEAHSAATQAVRRPQVEFRRLTDFKGMKESPSVSPDGKMVAFVAPIDGRRQVWIRLLAGGVPLQVTRDEGDHEHPRWAPDSSTLIYYTRGATPDRESLICEISALGGPARRVASAIGGGDISHDGRRVAVFQSAGDHVELAILARDGSGRDVVMALPAGSHEYPRWSPDDRWIAFQSRTTIYFDQRLYVISAAGGLLREVARGAILKGLSWLPDGSGLVYGSSVGSTVPYPPTFNLRTVGRDGTGDGQLTYGDLSYLEPDVHQSGKLLTCRIHSESDIWRFPVGGSPAENTRDAVQITRQTGQVQTPSVGPDGREVVYLSDTGGHGNLWVAKTDGGAVRQITFERDPAVSVGVPAWSPAGNGIAFVLTRWGKSELWFIRPDGGGLRQLVAQGYGAGWSGDGQWLYYTPAGERSARIEKVPVGGGKAIRVRDDDASLPVLARDGSVLYYVTRLEVGIGGRDCEIRRASPEDGPSQVLVRIAGSRIPASPSFVQTSLSPDGQVLAFPLADGATGNLWALPVDGGPMRPLTDFGGRAIVIARRISWSPDGRFLYAAVAETDVDVILLDGLLP